MTSSGNPSDPNQPPAPPQSGRFAILNVVPVGTPPSELFPGPGPTPNTVVPDPEDGPNPQTLSAVNLQVYAVQGPGRSAKQILNIHKVNASVLISDCRVAVACSKYDRGGRATPFTLGGLLFTVPFNAINRAQAKKRRSGNMMVGQVRYSWLVSVGCSQKTGPLSFNNLRLGLVLPGGQLRLILNITLPGMRTGEVAQSVVQRAARYQLAHEGQQISPDQRVRLEQLTQAPPLVTPSKGYTNYYSRRTGEPENGLRGHCYYETRAAKPS